MEHQHQPGAKSCQACEAQTPEHVITSKFYARSEHFIGPIMGTITQHYWAPRFRDGRMIGITPSYQVATNAGWRWAGPLKFMVEQMADAERGGSLMDLVVAA